MTNSRVMNPCNIGRSPIPDAGSELYERNFAYGLTIDVKFNYLGIRYAVVKANGSRLDACSEDRVKVWSDRTWPSNIGQLPIFVDESSQDTSDILSGKARIVLLALLPRVYYIGYLFANRLGVWSVQREACSAL